MSAQQYFAFANYKANGWRLQLMNGLLSILWAEKNSSQLGGFGLTCNISHFKIAHEAQVPWASCSPGIVPGPVRRKLSWTPECRWSQPAWWLSAERFKPWAEVPSLCQLALALSQHLPKNARPLQSCWWPGWPTHSPAHDVSTAWLFVWMGDCLHPYPGATMSRWRNAGWITEDASGARRGHGLWGWRTSGIFTLVHHWGAKRPSMWVVLSKSEPLMFLSEWNRKQQNKVGWHKTWASKYMF